MSAYEIYRTCMKMRVRGESEVSDELKPNDTAVFLTSSTLDTLDFRLVLVHQ